MADSPVSRIRNLWSSGPMRWRPSRALRFAAAVVGFAVLAVVAAIAVNAISAGMVASGAGPLADTVPVALAHLALIGAALLAIVGVGRYGGEGFLAGSWVFAPLAPVLAAAVSVVAYVVAPEDPGHPGVPLHPIVAVYLGLAAAAIGWMLFAFAGVQMADRAHAQMRVRDDLLQRFKVLSARVEAETRKTAGARRKPRPEEAKALAEAVAVLGEVRRELVDEERGRPALRWVLANGYTSIARELHRVEEALIAVQDPAAVVGDALHDDLSLEDSGLKNRFTLRRVIRDAMPAISPGAADALLRPVPALPQTAALVMRAQTQAASTVLSETEAREALREVRFALNDYRDDIVDSFARGRNRVIWTFLAVALTTYVLLGLGQLSGVPKTALVSVSVLYLVGSLVGLFSRLRIESRSPTTNEDYGLFLARLMTGPLLSGLAGVAGVYLIAQAPSFLGPAAAIGPAPASAGPSASPSPAEILAAASQLPQARALADVYDLTRNHLALLIAAIFGLAPGLLTAQLQDQVDRLDRELQRSEPATKASVAGTAPEGAAEDTHG